MGFLGRSQKKDGLEVVAQTAKVEGGEIVEYRTNVKVAFLVQDNR